VEGLLVLLKVVRVVLEQQVILRRQERGVEVVRVERRLAQAAQVGRVVLTAVEEEVVAQRAMVQVGRVVRAVQEQLMSTLIRRLLWQEKHWLRTTRGMS